MYNLFHYQEFIVGLQLEELQKLVTAAYSNEGGVELARALLQDPPQDPRGDEALPWCICYKCQPMDTAEENVCCRKRPLCVTQMFWFDAVVLNRDVLTLAIEAQCDVLGSLPDYRPNSYRKAAYRQFVIWQHGHLGRNNRLVIPSCVVCRIRRKYPAPDGLYMGYKEYREGELVI